MNKFKALGILIVAALGLAACTEPEPTSSSVHSTQSQVLTGMQFDFRQYSSSFSYRGFTATHKIVFRVTDVLALREFDFEGSADEARAELDRLIDRNACPSGDTYFPGPEYVPGRTSFSFTRLYSCF